MNRKKIESVYYVRPPVRISESRVKELMRAGVDPEIAALDLESVLFKLRLQRGWDSELARMAELEYKRHLTLILWNPYTDFPIVPTGLVDDLWHNHILDTRAYFTDTQLVFGTYLHHFPYLGLTKSSSDKLLERAFRLTAELYLRTFGEPNLPSGYSPLE